MAPSEDFNGMLAPSISPRHIVMVPLPSQGHVTPALQLAHQLASLGFRITFVNTLHNHQQMMKARGTSKVALDTPDKGIEFESVPDGLPDDHPRYSNFLEYNLATLSMGPVLEELLVRLQPITCVIRDVRMSAVHVIAKKLGIPVIGFITQSAVSQHCTFSFPALLSAGLLPFPAPPADCTPFVNPTSRLLVPGPPRSDAEAAARQTPVTSCISGVSSSLRVQDLPAYILLNPENYYLRIHRDIQNPLLPDCECILSNTFHELEGEVLDAMTGHMNAHVFAVGPLALGVSKAGSALRREDPVALSWLDGQNPNSVLFVSFGSVVTVSINQMREFAYGLEMSRAAFLWVIRTDSIVDEEKEEFATWFPEFVLRTKDRGLLVPWAPQTAVLAHPAVAAFLTHCGWNSVIESIVSGVPMLAWPRFADQPTNCRYITHVWKIGLRLEVWNGSDIISKEEIDQKVRKMMAKEDEEIDAIRANSRKLQMAAKKAVTKGGSSHTALAKFVEFIERRSMQAS